MSGDLLKQIQLTRQLEQKTKEAAKNRKEAEERLAEAERAVASLKSYDTRSVAVEKTLEEANQSFQQKDYKMTLSLAERCIKGVEEAKKDKIASIINSSETLLALFEDKRKGEEVSGSLRTAKDLLGQGKLEEALARARESWDASERLANSLLADMFSTAQSQVLIAERLKLDMSGQRQMLAHARQCLDANDFGGCVAQLRNCMSMTATALQNHLASRMEAMASAEQQALQLGVDFSRPRETLAKTKAYAEKGDFEHAFSTLGIAESEVRSLISNGLLNRFEQLKERAETLRAMGMEVEQLLGIISQGREMALNDRNAEGLEWWNAAEKLARSMETEKLVELVSRLRGRLLIAKRTNSNLTEVLDALAKARSTLNQGDFRSAVSQVQKAEEKLEKLLEGYREMESELTRTRSLMTAAIDLRLNITEAKSKVDSSRLSALRRDFSSAIKQLKEAQEIIHQAIQAHIGQDIMKAEMRVTSALKIGAEVSEESALLEDIIARAKAGRYAGLREELDECMQKVEAKMRVVAERTVSEARSLLETYEGPIDITPHRRSLQMAAEALKEGQALRAYELANSAMAMVKRDENDALQRRLDEARHLLSITKDMGCESSTLNDKLQRAEELRNGGKVGEGLRLAAEVVQFARSIVKDEVTRQLAQITRGISSARRNGIEVLPAERLAEESSRALISGDLLKGYSLMKEASSTLERLKAVHARIYERIVEIGSLLKVAEAHQLDATSHMEMLTKAKKLFEAGRYEEALPAIAKTFVETEKLVAPFLAPQKAQEAQGIIDIAKRLGYEMSAPQKRLEQAKKMIERQEYAQAMISVREVEKTVNSVLSKGLERELNDIKEKLLKTQSTGTDVSGPLLMTNKAESLMREGRLQDALRALELAKGELDQGLIISKKAEMAIQKAQALIDEAKSLGVSVEAAADLLRQAFNYQKLGRQGIAHELAKKAGDQAAAGAAEALRKRIGEAEEKYQLKGLQGVDLEALLRNREEMEKRIEAQRISEAAAQVTMLEKELERLLLQKEAAAQALHLAGDNLSRAREKGLKLEEEERTFSLAQQRFAEGAFKEAQTLARKCGEEVKTKEDVYCRRMTELKALEEELARLEGEHAFPHLRALTEEARKSLEAMDFEAASLHLHRGRQAISEALEAIKAERLRSLENLCMVAEDLMLNRNSIPKAVKDVLQLRGSGGSLDPEKLREALQAMNEVMLKKLSARIEAVQESIEEARAQGVDVTASSELLTKASSMLSENKWKGAANCILEAERAIGVQVEEQRRYVETRMKVEARVENARRNGLDMAEVVALYRQAESVRAKDHALAMELMDKALALAEKEAEEFLPDIEVSLHFHEPLRAGEWSKAVLELSNQAKAMAREVEIHIGGDMEMRGFSALPKLRGGERVRIEVEVRPSVAGKARVDLSLECRPVLSNDKVGYDTEFEVEV
ncbi:MAG: hypothetical protein QW520_05200 [Methanomassiliicoccales archaeon]